MLGLVATTGTRYKLKRIYTVLYLHAKVAMPMAGQNLACDLGRPSGVTLTVRWSSTGDLTSHLPPPHLACPPAYTRPLVFSRSWKASIALRIVVDMRLFTHFEFSSGLSTIGTE